MTRRQLDADADAAALGRDAEPARRIAPWCYVGNFLQ
jgi:hypothetical protein